MGITLIEILVVVSIILILLLVLTADFPSIQKQFALSRATYKFAQDLRRVQGMALSGVKIDGVDAAGYGIFIDVNPLSGDNKKYKIYADKKEIIDDELNTAGDNKYDYFIEGLEVDDQGKKIYELEIIDLAKFSPGIIVYDIKNTNQDGNVSINFSPPNPATVIDGLQEDRERVEITFKIESEQVLSRGTRRVYIYKSGLIEAE